VPCASGWAPCAKKWPPPPESGRPGKEPVSDLPLLILSPGDPGGIGPQICARAAAEWLAGPEAVRGRLAVCAEPAEIGTWSERLGLNLPLRPWEHARVGELPAGVLGLLGRDLVRQDLEPDDPRAEESVNLRALRRAFPQLDTAALVHGPDKAGGAFAWRSLAMAVDLVQAAPRRRALITAPISKEAMALAGYSWPGHTEYLGWRDGVGEPLMWLHSQLLSVALVCNHVPLVQVPRWVTPERVEAKARLAAAEVARRWPGETLFVFGLNPHAGDGGLIGHEERDVIAPVVARLQAEGLPVAGPVAADSALRSGRGRHLAMYHDQGLPAFKLGAGGHGVNLTLGLSFVRTSPDHGTAFDIAARGDADASSLLAAMREALLLLEDRRGG
jgi:4-hydroxythreonine-4-phosphate dehydrogenase